MALVHTIHNDPTSKEKLAMLMRMAMRTKKPKNRLLILSVYYELKIELYPKG